jgi:hypothetical protein
VFSAGKCRRATDITQIKGRLPGVLEVTRTHLSKRAIRSASICSKQEWIVLRILQATAVRYAFNEQVTNETARSHQLSGSDWLSRSNSRSNSSTIDNFTEAGMERRNQRMLPSLIAETN